MFIHALRKSSFRLGAVGSAFVLIFLVTLLLPGSLYNRGHLEVVFIDVGQGDSTLIKSPSGKFILIDGGGNLFYDVGAVKLLPYLHHRGIRKLDLVVSTHPDIDHLDGLISLAKDMKVDAVSLPASLKGSSEYKEFAGIAGVKGIPLLYLSQGQQIRLDENLVINVLHPDKSSGPAEKMNANNQSVVLLIKYQQFSLVTCGDIEKETMEEVLKENHIPPVTAVKVPHHGSRNSANPNFYKELYPNYAIISVGAGNNFGHPHQEIINLLQENKIKILRTDQSGAILFDTDGKRLQIKETIQKNNKLSLKKQKKSQGYA